MEDTDSTGECRTHSDSTGAAGSSTDSNNLNIQVHTVTGTKFTMCVQNTDTLHDIKNKISRVEGIPVSKQHLIYNYRELDDFSTLSDNSIRDGSTLRLVLSMHGGPISTRRLPVIDDIQWRDIRDFFENNRFDSSTKNTFAEDETFDWLPPGCRFLVYRDGDNVNIVKVVEDDTDETYIPENDFYFSEESAAHKCKMLDLRCKMEKKRNKSKNNTNDAKSTLQKSTSEETLSTALDGLFGEAPNALRYRPRRLYHHPNGDNASANTSLLNGDACRVPNKNVFSDIWSPISGSSNTGSYDNSSSSGKGWPTSATGYFGRPSPSTNEHSGSIDSFKDSVLASTSNSISYSNARTNIETVCVDPFQEPATLTKPSFVTERSLVKSIANEVLEADTIEAPEIPAHHPNLVKANVAGIAPLVLETQPVGAIQLPSVSTSQGPLLLAHASNTACNLRNDYHMAQVLGKDSPSDPDPEYFYQQSGPIKRVVRKVIFGSNSQLNSLPEVHECKESSTSTGDIISSPTYVQPLIGSEPQLDKLADSGSIANLCNSVSNLYVNANCKNSPCPEFKSGIKPSSMIFSSSTSDLLNLKRNKILPSLSRHRNSEHLDTSIENMDKVTISKEENPYCNDHVNSRIQMDDVIYGKERRYKSNESGGEWKDSYFREKLFGGKSYNVIHFDSQSRKINDSCHGIDDRSSGTAVHNIHLIPNKDYTRDSDCINRLFSGQSSHRHLEVGSERRFRRIKKNYKQDQDNHKSKESRKFLLGYGNQGYEATIYKMPNDCMRIEQTTTTSDRYIPSSDKKIAEEDTQQGLPSLKESTDDEMPKKSQRMRCAMCKKRLTIATVHTCRCGIVFCAPHRYAEVHGCQYDYKAEGQEYLRRVNPLVSAPKLPKI